MQIEERSYAGKYFRPKPVILSSDEPQSLLVLTSWGERDETDRVISVFQEQLKMDESMDMTTPFGRIDGIGHKANQIRTAALLANDFLFREANRNEFICGLEFLGLVYDKGILSWVQIGAPTLLLQWNNQIQPLAYFFDQSWQYHQNSPLLSMGLGIEQSCQLNCGSLHIDSGAELFLVSRDSVSPSIFQHSKLNLQSLTQLLVKTSEQSPFWVGHLKL